MSQPISLTYKIIDEIIEFILNCKNKNLSKYDNSVFLKKINNLKKKKIFYFNNTFQSKLTHKIVLDIFNNNCKLINFENYKFIQLQILKSAFKKLKIFNKKTIRFT